MISVHWKRQLLRLVILLPIGHYITFSFVLKLEAYVSIVSFIDYIYVSLSYVPLSQLHHH